MESLNLSKYRLRIEKEGAFKHHHQYTFFYFAILDLSKGAMYPLSWVCNLPKDAHGVLTNKRFSKAFPDIDRIEFALALLEDAKKEYTDPDIVTEIERRIQRLKGTLKVRIRIPVNGLSIVRKEAFKIPVEGLKIAKGETLKIPIEAH
jgi:hypothetical protein